MYGGAWAYNKISFLNFETTSMVSRRKPEIITTTTEAVFRKIVPTGYGNEVCKVKKGKNYGWIDISYINDSINDSSHRMQ